MALTNKEKEFLKVLDNPSPGFVQALKKKMSGILGTAGSAVSSVYNKAKSSGIETDFGLSDVFEEQAKGIQRNKEILIGLGEAQKLVAQTSRDLATESRALFGDSAIGNKVVSELSQNFRTFAFLQKDVQREIAKSTMVLTQFGVDAGTTSKILDSASMAFGMSQKKLGELANELATVVYRFPGQASEIARNFSAAQSSLAYDSGKIMQVFKKLQETSSTTGVSFDKLTSAFGDSMDTFESSSNKAGSLNAILGRSVFNSIDLLGKTEAERVDTIVKGVRSSIGGDVNKLGKFQLKAVAEGMGLTVEETRRLLTGQSTVDDVIKGKEASDPKMQLQKQANQALNSNTMKIEELITVMKTYESDRELAIRKLNAENTKSMLTFARAKLGFGEMTSLEEIPERFEQGLQVFLRDGTFEAARAAAGMTREQFAAQRTGQFTGNLLAEDITVEKRQQAIQYFTQLIKDIGDSEEAQKVKMAVKKYAKRLDITIPGISDSAEGGSQDNDSGSPGSGTGTGGGSSSENLLDSAMNKLKSIFTDGTMKVEITGLTGNQLEGLLRQVKAGE